MKEKFRVIILGAGSTGSSIAFNLAKKGETDVLLLDRSCAGCGQTGVTSALVRLHYTNPVIREMAVYSWRFIRERFSEEVECDLTVFTETGIGFGAPEEGVKAAEDVVRSLKSMGVETELYDPEDFKREVFKHINIDGLAAVAWEPHSGYGDPSAIVSCYVSYARKMGVKVMENNPVKRLIVKDRRIEAVETEKGVFKAELVVNALGVWANRLLKPIGAELPIRIGREEVLVVRNPRRKEVVPPGWGDLALGFYSRPEGEALSIIGGLYVDYPEVEPEPGRYSKPPLRLVDMRMPPFVRRFPEMADAELHSGWYGFYDITPDWQPIIGWDRKIKNLIHMVGLSGHGFKLSPAYGDVISDIVIYGKAKRFDVSRFSIRRFEEGISERSRYKYGIVG